MEVQNYRTVIEKHDAGRKLQQISFGNRSSDGANKRDKAGVTQ